MTLPKGLLKTPWRNDLAVLLYSKLKNEDLHPFEEWLYLFYLSEEAPELHDKYYKDWRKV